mgnify:CR=1 FL=1
MTDPRFPHHAVADLHGVAFSAMRQMILMQSTASELTILEDAEHSLTVQTAHGLVGLRPGQVTETAGMVAADSERG